jgi:hypothetical protein
MPRKPSMQQKEILDLLRRLIGHEGRLDVNGMRVAVRITGVRRLFGRPEVSVAPIAGEGEAWVVRDEVQLVAKPREEVNHNA